MRNVCLMLSRFCLAAWVGATALFVGIAIRPIRSPLFDTIDKAHLSQILFPSFYHWGLAFLTCALLTGCFSRGAGRSIVRVVSMGFTLLALLLLIADWLWIYAPLANLVAEQLTQRTAPASTFRGYHLASMAINAAGLACSFIAALTSCWPVEQPVGQHASR